MTPISTAPPPTFTGLIALGRRAKETVEGWSLWTADIRENYKGMKASVALPG